MLLPSALLSIILSSNRAVVCHLSESRDANLGLLQSLPVVKQFCDVVNGDVLEGDFSIPLLTTSRHPCKLFLLRNRLFPAPGQSPGFVQFSRLGRGDKLTLVEDSLNSPCPPRRRRNHRQQPVRLTDHAGPLFLYHRFSLRVPSCSDSVLLFRCPTSVSICTCFITPSTSSHLHSCPLCSRHPPSRAHRRPARVPASSSPLRVDLRQAPHHAPHDTAIDVCQPLPRQVHNLGVVEMPANVALRFVQERRLWLQLSTELARDWESDLELDGALAALRRLFSIN